MSASKNDRLGRNPFDRGTYSKPSTTKASKAKARKSAMKAKRASASTRLHQDAVPAWRLLLNEIDRRSPQAVRDLKICKRVAALVALAASRLSQVARHLEA